jgi:lipopolysaccharide/colanic/teichoic acid biosynthesis glycosyltransferase
MNDFPKRLFDVVLSSFALVLISPIMLLIACWIKLDSIGPVFFLQYRAGLHGKAFCMIKFRTMVHRSQHEIDQYNEPVVSEGRDFRITRAGRFIRAVSFDELPQLFNILKGDMSIVGPRPVLMEQLEVVPPGYMKRFNVRPGLTGLAQVRGRRSLNWLRQLAFDVEYVEGKSFLKDIVIILKTFKVLMPSGPIYGGEELNWRSYRKQLKGRLPEDKDVEEELK